MTEEEIQKICEQYNIENYRINSDMTIDVNGNVNLSYIRFAIPNKLPLKFNKVTGFFYCEYSELTTLEGCPKFVGTDFDCSGNSLTTLKHCPNHVGGDFISRNNSLNTLKHLPINFYIGGNIGIQFNKIKDVNQFGRLFFGHIDGNIYTNYAAINTFLNKNKNPPKKDLPRLLSELRKITL